MKYLKTIIYFFAFLFLFGVANNASAANVFYSVGQSAADLKTGSPSVSIASGVATFSVAQVGNIGVGDRVTYNTNSVAYIASKTSTTVWNVVTKTGGAPADVTSQTVNSIGREYTSLSAAEAGATDSNHLNTTDLVTGNYILNLPAYYDTAADTTAVTIDGWTTGAQNYIKIYTPNNTSTEANQSQRHSGKWDTGKYRLEIGNSFGIRNNEPHLRIDGLQIRVTSTNASSQAVIRQEYATGLVNSELWFSNNIIRGFSSNTYSNHHGIQLYDSGNGIVYAYNNIVYDIRTTSGNAHGIQGGDSDYTFYVFNNTVYNCNIGIYNIASNLVVAKNNIAYNNTDNYYGTSFHASSTNNLSGPTQTDAPGTNPQNAKTVSFINEPAKDFHLSPSDTSAKNMGADLSADPNLPIANDIDGHTRPTLGVFDIGADEATTPVFYSVGQNTNDHKTGSPTVTIASGVATFSVAQVATNMGVGDKVTYNTSTIAYISGKVSETTWSVITATGGTPSNVSGQTVNSIAHAFASLSAAEAGAPGASYLNTSNLVTGNFQLNFPCYYDTAADTTAVTIDGWTTGANSYIKIYTPNNASTEVNVSQRHSGKWDTSKYYISTTSSTALSPMEEYTRIDGIQISQTPAAATYPRIVYVLLNNANSDVRLSNSILKANYSAVTGAYYPRTVFAYGGVGGTLNFNAWNNIIYYTAEPGNTSGASTLGCNYAVCNFYNNTIINYSGSSKSYGIYRDGGTIIAKNNIVKGFGNTQTYSGAFAAGTDYNATDGTDNIGQGSNNRISQTFSFADEANADFHLTLNDTGAKGFGVSLAQDSSLSFQNDIDGQHRSGGADGTPWDIGADEYVGTEIQSSNQRASSLTDGLVLYQSFDGQDVSGTTAFDRSGLGNNGVISGATVKAGKRGQGLDFDGVSNSIIVPDSNSLDITGAVTLSAWYYPNNMNAGWYVLAAKDGGGSDSNYWLGRNGSKFYLTFINASWHNHSTVNTYTANQWYHVVGVIDSVNDTMKIYVNGVLDIDTQVEAADMIASNDSLYIGRDNGNNTTVNGKIDEVRVYNRALSVSEIGNLYTLGQEKINMSLTNKSTTGLVGMWSFDGNDIYGNTAYDRSGLGNHGAISGATAKAGKRGQALSFNGTSNSRVDFNSTPLINSTAPFTVSYWARLDAIVNYAIPLTLRTDSAQNWRTYYAVGNNSVWFGRRGGWIILKASLSSTPMNTWHHIVVTYNGSDSTVAGNFKFYDNGSSTAIEDGGGFASDTGNSRIGGFTGGDQWWWNGLIDEVRVYNRALSADEIKNLFNLGNAKILP